MTAPYAIGDKVRYQGTEYTVRAIYEAENGGWELRAVSADGVMGWLDSADVEPVTEPVVDVGQGELF